MTSDGCGSHQWLILAGGAIEHRNVILPWYGSNGCNTKWLITGFFAETFGIASGTMQESGPQQVQINTIWHNKSLTTSLPPKVPKIRVVPSFFSLPLLRLRSNGERHTELWPILNPPHYGEIICATTS
ncbi:hypothetical protein DFH08DRAFT_814252 [Mycena albidolilacea]|uniref:Uncharacterized protein n=1 Tax=Mycena albidolilacea TaxID=1033008 RepID=A0AAD7EKE2_9AGAR|nr:hypothetical protein DFH08DRAFT_814252 [Mycena albidolilacea]